MPASASAVRATVKALRDASPDDGSDAGTSKAVKTILNSRKCWRNMKGKEEAVWPPELESALIEGLERYRPAEAKSNRVLGRFPMRNKFVADHIFETTGHRRTPKQVGSRIQQLRDTSSGKHILKAISDKHYELMHPKRPHIEDGRARPSGSRSVAAQPHLTSSSMPLSIPVSNEVYINILPPHSAFYPPSSSVLLSEINAHDARPLHAIDPTVSFRLRGQMLCQAVFHIYKNGHFVQQECAPMTVSCGPPISEPGSSFPLYTYSTTLVPQHWSLLCEIDDLSAYTIHLQAVRLPMPTDVNNMSSTLLSTIYHFVDASASAYALAVYTPPLSPRSSCGEAEADFAALSSGSSPSPLIDAAMLRTPPLLGGTTLVGMPELLFNFEDECSSNPSTPVDYPTNGLWNYAQSISSSASSVSSRSPLPPSPLALTEPQTSLACDPYMDATALFDSFVYH